MNEKLKQSVQYAIGFFASFGLVMGILLLGVIILMKKLRVNSE